ncbi:MAG: HAMP domain-containing protein [Pirellulales bacterium]|nr:HAMP domain-containing protein [Pirellulales bacterium]
MHKKRLWWRLFIVYLWVPVIVLLSVSWYGSDVVWRLYESQINSDLEARARLCSKPIDELLARGRVAEIDAVCKELGQSSNTRITVVLPSGQVVGDSNEAPRNMDNHSRRAEILEALEGKVGHSQRYSSTEQEERIYVAIPSMRDGLPVAVVRTSFPLTALTRAMGIVHKRILMAALIGIVLHAMITMVISRRMSRPLEEIKAGAERFAAGDLGHRLRVTDSVEIDTLAETMNRMAEQLDERIQTVLRQQNEREAMLSSMEEGVLAIDNEGTILSLNKACATLLGEEPAKLQGREIFEVIRKADLLKFIESALASASPVEGEIQIRGNQDRWVSAHGTVLQDSQRGKIGVLIVLHDVTRLRHLEEVRRDFVANVSHELRTPITSIKGFAETLVDGAFEDEENAHRFLQIMLRQVNRLDAIIADLLMLSRIERGAEEQRIELAPESIRETLQAAIEMCEKKAIDKAVRIELFCPEDLTGEINAALLEQAVVNLLDNAVKYSNSDAVIEVHAASEQSELVIHVKDQGCGIDARHLARLFERFYRVDKARSRELGGTGLGLAIVRHIALAHRGSVSVESTVGVGSTFCLRLPMASANSPD